MKSSISNKIRKLRFENQEMSQQSLADVVGVTRQTIFAIEKGKYSPSLEVAFRIVVVFSVNLDEVFQYHGQAGVRVLLKWSFNDGEFQNLSYA